MKKGESSKKVVFITGASSGIGKSIATYLSKRNFKVYGTSRNPDKSSIKEFDLVALDVTDPSSIERAIAEVATREGKIDVLINNAGVGITGPIEETPESEIKKAFETNYFGPLNVIKSVLPVMRKNREGLIINITSIAGYMGLPYRGIYSATKGALEITAEAYRMELKQFNIKMTNIAPGDFATNIASGRYHAPVTKGSPYEKVYGNTLKLMNDHVDAGKDPNLMAEEVYRVIQEKDPRVHYKVGERLQKFSVLLKGILPDKVYEKMLMKHYKL
ncbi:SDR family oxidoreductase [Christiangramia salexigens]|uniref:Short-chain dehydrogenase/reductase n=1 Tax=Christiangramia salexigens TaxID=1913577 RepID=A0A1L3J4A3_9FLAO|nr:SDR family oxidoreductase [Christiangramia salexigens]APG59967.1 short-chain dehydrogenase/reductase [Christiangramia salexigens]